ncbi:DUF5658 family protein [Paenibacillaceae bacterium WGS1546]|uniref:DUF5658 family protein n=1 Tax=Cohnella sp. WGS1546 TaxID=3366810 RepID=UPI00372D05E0
MIEEREGGRTAIEKRRSACPAAAAGWIAVLSLFDAAATDAGIRMQAIGEWNPLAGWLYEKDVALFYGVKLVMPLLLLILLRRMRRNDLNGSRRIGRLLGIAVVAYGAVACYHLGWIFYLVWRAGGVYI